MIFTRARKTGSTVSKGKTPWRTSIVGFATSAGIVFVINLAALLWAVSRGKSALQDSGIVLREGQSASACESVKRTNTWLHLLINILSTIILAGSNYCMQCLCAPSRADIIKQHQSGKYLDIGIPSIHNIKYFSGRRRWTWLGLLISSLPLHLFYNSVVYTRTSSNNYAVFSVGQDFLNTTDLSQYSFEDHSSLLDSGIETSALNTPENIISEVATDLSLEYHNGTVIRLQPAACIQQYLGTFQSSYRNLLLVTDNETTTIKYLEARFYRDFRCNNEQASTWICAYVSEGTSGYEDQCTSDCSLTSMQSAMHAAVVNGSWAPLGDPVQYCLAQKSTTQCSVQANLVVLIVVLVFNAAKVALMLYVLFYAIPKSNRPLLCIGDSVASFLDFADPASSDKCLLSRSLYDELLANSMREQTTPPFTRRVGLGPVVRPYLARRRRWSGAVSGRRWTICILLYLVGLAIASGYLSLGINNITGPKNFQALWSIGFGNVNAEAIAMTGSNASGNSTLVQNVLLANIAQLILSMLYFTYNGLFTGMLLAREWDGYGVRRQGLRVNSTKPVGHQRSSYFLQLPYRWSLPLIVFSLFLHWLVSQSVFVVNIQMMDYFGQPLVSGPNRVGHLLTIGYSPVAIIFFILTAGLLVIAVLVAGSIRLRSAIPLASSNSLAIAAACHPALSKVVRDNESGKDDLPMSAQLLQWGETGQLEPSHVSVIRDTIRSQARYPQQRSAYSTSAATGYARVQNSEEIELDSMGSYNRTTFDGSHQTISKPPQVSNSEVVVEEEQAFLQTNSNAAVVDVIYHCSFSAERVDPLVEGREYA